MKKIWYLCLFLLLAVSCKSKKEPVPAESLPDDGINPTTETEIFDSLATVTGTQLKSMRIKTYYYPEGYNPYTYEETFHYEYDYQKRLTGCTSEFPGSGSSKRTVKLVYNENGYPDEITLVFYDRNGYPPQQVKLTVENDGKYLKIVPPRQRLPYFPPIKPSEDSYKYFAMINKENEIVQMARSENGLIGSYYSFSYDAKRNPVNMSFTYTDVNGQLVKTDDQVRIEHTRYVRSPFNDPMFGLVHGLVRDFGVNANRWFREFGVNMPVKVSAVYLSGGMGPSSRFGYIYTKIIPPLKFDFVYHYNTKKLPTLAVATQNSNHSGPSIDSTSFEYQ